jgi:hypothetical protein
MDTDDTDLKSDHGLARMNTDLSLGELRRRRANTEILAFASLRPE